VACPLWADNTSQSDFTFGTFWGELDRSIGPDKTLQINELKRIGFAGIAGGMWQQQGLELLEEYQSAIGDEPLKVYAGFVRVFFSKDLVAQQKHLDEVIEAHVEYPEFPLTKRNPGGQNTKKSKLRKANSRT